MKSRPSPETARTHKPGWRGCGATLDLPDWPTGGICGEVGVMCYDCWETDFGQTGREFPAPVCPICAETPHNKDCPRAP